MSVLAEKVLVLNKGWHPINITTVREAVSMSYQGAASILDPKTFQPFDFNSWKEASEFAQEGSKYLRGCDWKMLVPEVIVLTSYNGVNKRQVKFSRRNLYFRDRNTCQYCGRKFHSKDLTIDHVVPKSKGGRSIWTNVVLACYACNRKKDNRLLEKCGMHLLRPPKQPRWEEVKIPSISGKIPASWEQFLSEMYWNVELKD